MTVNNTNKLLVTDQYQNVSEDTLDSWVEQFHRQGFLFLESVLQPEIIENLKADLDSALADRLDPESTLQIQMKMFETSQANVSLFDMEPMVSFAEKLVAPDCHVFHNNSFLTRKGGGISEWHQDDDCHYLVEEGEPPTNVKLPVLFFTANYYLTDVLSVENGPTQLVPGSHLFGSRPPGNMGGVNGDENALVGTQYEPQVFSALGPAGSVICFNNQIWHRGAKNMTDTTRYITQVSYGRRIIGSMYSPFMNYQMPAHVYEGADARRRRLLGFKGGGAYG